jgi:hypothetical protein
MLDRVINKDEPSRKATSSPEEEPAAKKAKGTKTRGRGKGRK